MRDDYQNRPNASKVVNLPYVEKMPKENTTTVETPVAVPAPEASAKKDVLGVVADCSSLLIREKPDKSADIVAAVTVGSELMVDRENSANGFYKVWNAAGIEGYCVKQYVNLKA